MDSSANGEQKVSNCEVLMEIWSKLLNRPQIGILEDFFEAGGSSMQLIDMLWTVSNTFGKEVDHVEFLKEPCIRRLSELLEA
jgi:acyl carrier protein